jgi:hypothetical protein
LTMWTRMVFFKNKGIPRLNYLTYLVLDHFFI